MSASKRFLVSSVEKVPFIKPSDICFNIIDNVKEQISTNDVPQADIEIVCKQSILIAFAGVNTGNIAILAGDAIVHRDIFYATIQNPLVKPMFLYYYLSFKRDFFVKSSKTSYRVSINCLRTLNIPVPSVKQQDDVVKYLDIHLTRIVNCINDLKKLLVNIKVEQQELLNSYFPLQAPENVYRDLKLLTLKECGIIKAGKTPNTAIKNYYGTTYPLFKSAHLCQNMQVKISSIHLSLRGVNEAGYINANSLIVCTKGLKLGMVGITRCDCACSQQMISLSLNEFIIPEFAYFQMNSNSFQTQIIMRSKNRIIIKSAFGDIYLQVPGLESQRNIIKAVTAGINLITTKKKQLNAKLGSLENARRDLLQQALTIKIFG